MPPRPGGSVQLTIRLTHGTVATLTAPEQTSWQVLLEWLYLHPIADWVEGFDRREPLPPGVDDYVAMGAYTPELADFTEIWAEPRPGTGTQPYLIGTVTARPIVLVDGHAAAAAVRRPRSTIRRWAHEHLIERAGTDARGRALYDLQAVHDLAAARTKRKTRR